MSKLGSPIPTRLLVPGPADSIGQPTTPPRTQELPIGELSFENLQRLSVRLLSSTKGTIHCQEYGTPGQSQEGIDLYARLQGESKIEVWQCKRYATLTATHVSDAVSEFLKGSLLAETKKFVLVTSANTEDRRLADADMAAAKDLLPHQIEFVLIGRTQLTAELKDHPKIIDDFFGRYWVEVCCGKEKADRLGERLSAEEVSKYRTLLGKLYASIFDQADSLLARSATSVGNHQISLPLPCRWVMPTLSCRIDFLAVPQREANTQSGMHNAPPDEVERQNALATKSSSLPMNRALEMSAEVFIGSTERGVILGDPGYGKSALLRVVALDLLSDSPAMRPIADRFGNRLPVWLPFAFVSAKVAAGESVANAASAWVRKNGGDEELEQLLRRAVNDDRLLLLIDGLDEWSDQDRARETVVAIQGFLSQHPAGCFITARPLGYERLDRLSGDWKHGTLQPLSTEQQSTLAALIFKRLRSVTSAQAQQIEIEKFIRQLQQEYALGAMAATPLLLVGLVSLWVQNQALPRSRLAVCEALVKEMMEDHPSRRASVSASIPALSSVSSQIRRGALACLAWSIHTSADGAFLARNAAEKCFCDFFQESEGMPLSEARAHAREMLPISDQIIGVLAEASSGGDVQFVHRIFQEYLAAEHLSSFSIEDQVRLCADNASDPVWHQVLLFLIQKSNRPGETDRMIHALDQSRPKKRDELQAKLLLAEVLFSQVRMSASFRAERAKAILDEIESGTCLPLRETLLDKVLAASPGTNVYTLLIDRLRAWAPKPGSLYVYNEIATWPADSGAEAALWSLVNHEDVYEQIRAARALARRCKGQEEWRKRFLARLHEPLGCEALGACLLALAEGWFQDAEVIDAFGKGRDSVAPEIVLPSILGLINAGQHNHQCRTQLLKHGNTIWFKEIAVEAALKGWPGDNEIKDAALRCISSHYSLHEGAFNHESAWQVAIEGYPGDDDVARAISVELSQDYPNFGYSVTPKLLLSGFAGHPLVVAASEMKLRESKSAKKFVEPQLIALAKTDASKMELLECSRAKGGAQAMHCLQCVWGSEDLDFKNLVELHQGDDSDIETFITFLAFSAADKNHVRKKLIDSFDSASQGLLNLRIIAALSSMRTAEPDDEVVEAALRCFEGDDDRLHSPYGGYALISGFSDHPKVRMLADHWMKNVECDWGTISKAYRNDIDIQNHVKQICRALPESLRFDIALECRQRAAYEPELRVIAEGFRCEKEADVRIVGAIAVAEAMISNNEDTAEITGYFAKETTAVGMQRDARIQAGIAGLIALGEISQLIGMRGYNNKPPSIHFLYSQKSRNILPRFIVRNWSQLKTALGDEFWGRFESDNDVDMLRGVALEIGKADIAEEIGTVFRGRVKAYNAKLSSLASENSPGWVEACLRAMGLEGNTNSIRDAEAHEASRILAKYGAGSSAIQERLEQLVDNKNVWSEYALVSLALGWPASKCVKSAWANRKLRPEEEIGIHDAMLVATCAGTEEFIKWLRRWLQTNASSATHWDFNEGRWHVLRRCFADTEVASFLLTTLKVSDSPNEWVSFPWLIRSSSLEMANHKVREWAEERWSATAKQDWCVFGFDLFECRYVSLKESLLDLLLTDKAYSLT